MRRMLLRKIGHVVNCREATQLISQAQDGPLPWQRAFFLRMHLRVCRTCASFDSQMTLLREAMRRYRS